MDISNKATAERIRRLNGAVQLADADRASLAGTVAADGPYDYNLDQGEQR
jgi:hypothetical protein